MQGSTDSEVASVARHMEMSHWLDSYYTSSAVLVRQSKPTNEKKRVADPASKPFTPKGKYLKNQ